jgi:hypothetical protein
VNTGLLTSFIALFNRSVAQDVTESSKNDRAIAAMAHELRQLVGKFPRQP